MSKLTSIVLITICFSLQCFAQKQIISLQKQEPDKLISSASLYEDKDVSQYKIPEGIEDFVIGYLSISYPHSLYNNRHRNEERLLEYQNRVKKDDIDTMQFAYNKLHKTWLNVLIYMQNGIKHCILDTDFDDSFVNEQVFTFNTNDSISNNNRFFTNLSIPVDPIENSIAKQVPIGIANNIGSSCTGDNVIADSLQIKIYVNISYQGFFIDDVDTIWVDLYAQNFDQLYTKTGIGILGWCSNKAMNFYAPIILGQTFQIRNHKYVFEDFDIYNKTLELKRLEDDEIGTNRGNYFADTPELSSLSDYTLVFFTGSWCRPCKPVLDSLLVFHQQHPEITIISVNQERDSAAFIKYINDYNIPWKAICDKINEGKYLYSSTYYIHSVPQLLLINPKRRVLDRRSGTDPCVELIKEIKEKGCKAFEIKDY
ncbi:MAG: thioredoxin family protein [Lentimicrobiaceae bacterium]|nr:thioredoxin family protein [Lentimicrobiaceae bacterium]